MDAGVSCKFKICWLRDWKACNLPGWWNDVEKVCERVKSVSCETSLWWNFYESLKALNFTFTHFNSAERKLLASQPAKSFPKSKVLASRRGIPFEAFFEWQPQRLQESIENFIRHFATHRRHRNATRALYRNFVSYLLVIASNASMSSNSVWDSRKLFSTALSPNGFVAHQVS